MKEIYWIVICLLLTFTFGWAAFTIVGMEKLLDKSEQGADTWRCYEYNQTDMKCTRLHRNKS